MEGTRLRDHPPTVLVVDDEPDILESLSRYLRITLPGTTILTAPSAEAALPMASADDVDVVVSDVRMPGMDGLAFMRRLAPGIHRILITAFHEPELEERAADLGVEALLWKPFDMTLLRSVVQRALDGARGPRRGFAGT